MTSIIGNTQLIFTANVSYIDLIIFPRISCSDSYLGIYIPTYVYNCMTIKKINCLQKKVLKVQLFDPLFKLRLHISMDQLIH